MAIPKMLDVTFLPQFHFGNGETGKSFVQNQHQYASLSTDWNTVLSHAAMKWRGGHIFMPELNNIAMNQVRAEKLYSMKITDTSRLGTEMPFLIM